MGSNKTERTDIKAEIRILMYGYHLIWKVLVQYLVNTEQNVLWYRIIFPRKTLSRLIFRFSPPLLFLQKNSQWSPKPFFIAIKMYKECLISCLL